MGSKNFFRSLRSRNCSPSSKMHKCGTALARNSNFFPEAGNVKCKFHLGVHSALVSMRARPPPNKKNRDAPAHMPAPLALPSAPLLPPNWNFLAPPMLDTQVAAGIAVRLHFPQWLSAEGKHRSEHLPPTVDRWPVTSSIVCWLVDCSVRINLSRK